MYVFVYIRLYVYKREKVPVPPVLLSHKFEKAFIYRLF